MLKKKTIMTTKRRKKMSTKSEEAILKAAADERAASRSDAIFDQDTQRLVRIFQRVFDPGYVELDQVKYVKQSASAIESAGQLFEYLGLAVPDKQSPLGWRPTPLLLDMINKQPSRKSRWSDKPTPTKDELLFYLMQDSVFGAGSDGHRPWSLTLGYEVLHWLGLLRDGSDGYSAPTHRLLRLFEDAYYKRLAASDDCSTSPATGVGIRDA